MHAELFVDLVSYLRMDRAVIFLHTEMVVALY